MDIVEWLRDYYHMDSKRYSNVQIAVEIERLREALKRIADYEGGPVDLIWEDMTNIARSALQQKAGE